MLLKMNRVLFALSIALLAGCQSDHAAHASMNAPLPLSAETQACLKGYGVSYNQLADQFALFQTSLKQDDPHKASVLISYPLRVNSVKNKQHVSTSIQNAAQFIMQWPSFISVDVKKKILATNGQDSNQMICNYQGIGFANGLVWFSADSSAQIYVMNNIA